MSLDVAATFGHRDEVGQATEDMQVGTCWKSRLIDTLRSSLRKVDKAGK